MLKEFDRKLFLLLYKALFKEEMSFQEKNDFLLLMNKGVKALEINWATISK